MVDFLVTKSTSGKCWKGPHVSCKPPVRVRRPDLAVLYYWMLEPLYTLIRFTDGMIGKEDSRTILEVIFLIFHIRHIESTIVFQKFAGIL